MYKITQEQRDRYNEHRRAKKAAESPEEREARLSKRREYERRKRIEGGEALRKRTRAVAIAWINKKRLEDPDYGAERYKRSKLKKEQLAEDRVKNLKEGEKLCPRCLFVRELEDFPLMRSGERSFVCSRCYKQMTGAYDFSSDRYWSHKANQAYQRARRSAKDEAHLQRITGADLRDLFEKQNHKCAYCGMELTPLILAIDHKVPKARGGSHTLENIQLVCHNCNISKFTLTDEEYRNFILQK